MKRFSLTTECDNNVMKHSFGLTIDHIDPVFNRKAKKHGFSLVCWLHVLANLTEMSFGENVKKSDAFVPFRVKEHAAPRNPGDIGEFWIDGAWTVTEFLGDLWWNEARELGFSKSDLRKRSSKGGEKHTGKKYFNDGIKNTVVMPGEKVPEGLAPGMVSSDKRKHGKSRWVTDGQKDTRISTNDPVPEGFRPGRSNGPGFSILNSASSEVRTQRAKNANAASQDRLTRNEKGQFQRRSDTSPS
jgi:hypothetical protein